MKSALFFGYNIEGESLVVPPLGVVAWVGLMISPQSHKATVSTHWVVKLGVDYWYLVRFQPLISREEVCWDFLSSFGYKTP